MFCMYCGNRLPDNALFCNKCGSRQNTATIPANPSMTNTFTEGGEESSVTMPFALAVFAILGLLGAYIYLTAQIQNSTSSPVALTSVIGSGIWIYIIAMIAVIVGGILQLRSSH